VAHRKAKRPSIDGRPSIEGRDSREWVRLWFAPSRSFLIGEARAGAPSSSCTEDVRTDEMLGDRIEARTAPSWAVVSSTVTVSIVRYKAAASERLERGERQLRRD
jgi:hypothetical protein